MPDGEEECNDGGSMHHPAVVEKGSAVHRKGASRHLYLGLGVAFLALGYVGYIVPVMPGTVFFILALWAFKRGSPRLEAWLLNTSFIGPTLRDWEQDRSMRTSTKVLAISVLWLSIAVSCAVVWQRPSAAWLVPTLLLVAAAVSVYIATRKTKV